MPPKNKVWRHFERNPDKSGTCRYCGVLVKTSGNTSSLIGHMQRKHPEMLLSPVPGSSAGGRAVSAESVILISEEQEAVANLIAERQPPEPGPSPAPPQVRVRQEAANASRRVKRPKEGDVDKITKVIVRMVCQEFYPINIMDQFGFRHLLNVAAPLYTVPTKETLKQLVREKYDAVSARLRRALENKMCSLTTDTWTDVQGQTFHSLTAHYHNDEDELCSATLGVVPLEELCTSDYLAKKLKQWCGKWGIRPETDVTAVVMDSAEKMNEATELAFGKEKHIPCFCHGLNSVVEACLGIQAVSKLLLKANKVVEWFKENIKASDKLRRLSGSGKTLSRSVPTRCNSTYHMLQRLIDLNPYVSEIINRHPDAPPMLTAQELEDAGEILQILEPFEAATKLLVEERYLASSMVIPVSCIILDKLEKLHPNKDVPLGVLAEAIAGMKSTFGTVEHVFLLAVATLLDPRFKKMYFRDPIALSEHVTSLRNCLNKDSLESAESIDSGSSSESDDVMTASNYLFREHNKTVQKKWQQLEATCGSPVPEELALYLGSPLEKIQENPFRYWKQMQTTYPNLAKVARRYLSAVASSVPAAWLYTKEGEMISISREEFKGKLLPKVLFLQSVDDKLWECK